MMADFITSAEKMTTETSPFAVAAATTAILIGTAAAHTIHQRATSARATASQRERQHGRWRLIAQSLSASQ